MRGPRRGPPRGETPRASLHRERLALGGGSCGWTGADVAGRLGHGQGRPTRGFRRLHHGSRHATRDCYPRTHRANPTVDGRVTAALVFHVLWVEHENRAFKHKLSLADVRRGFGRGDFGQRGRVLACGEGHWHFQPRSPWNRGANERPRTDGAHHHQRRPSTRDHFRGAIRDSGHYGSGDDAHGLAHF